MRQNRIDSGCSANLCGKSSQNPINGAGENMQCDEVSHI